LPALFRSGIRVPNLDDDFPLAVDLPADFDVATGFVRFRTAAARLDGELVMGSFDGEVAIDDEVVDGGFVARGIGGEELLEVRLKRFPPGEGGGAGRHGNGVVGVERGQVHSVSSVEKAAPAVAAKVGRGGGLSIVSGSENKTLEPLLQEFARRNGARIDVSYLGSVEIGHEIARGTQCSFDSVWPAASLWIDLFDEAKVTRSAQSIMRTPVVFALKRSVAESLGWVGKDVHVMDILNAAQARKIRFAMTSATQSNSGASAYLGFLNAFAGSPEVLTSEELKGNKARELIKKFLGSVNRSSGSSGFLKDLMVERYELLDGMVNYEAMVIEANQALVAQGRESLYVIYPVDALTIADSPLAFVNKGDAAKEKLFKDLQQYLLSPEAQKKIQALGRRTGLVGMGSDSADPRVFNKDWGIDLERMIAPVRMPSGPVIREALELYQIAFRKPSCTVFVLDFSGSMRGAGEAQVKEAMRTLLTPSIASKYLLQLSPADMTVVMPYSDRVAAQWVVEGNNPKDLDDLMQKIENQNPMAGTMTHAAMLQALTKAKEYASTGKYHTSVILMSDGEATDSLEDFLTTVERQRIGRDIPIYTVLFGDAKEKDMKKLAQSMAGRMFDGRKDMARAFREAKGYN
jgi:Ca-activated chloride channel family protein